MQRHDLTPQQLASATAGRLVAGTALGRAPRLRRVVTDSRGVSPGDVFFALSGTQQNGADFVADAWSRGAIGAVTTDKHVLPPRDRFAIVVDDAQQALWNLAAALRNEFTGTVIGVTGSVGKTTSREMIHTVLASKYEGVASTRNYNNHVGLPLSLTELGPSHRYGVFELGASAPGEILQLAKLCRPRIAVITRIAEAHLAGFGSLDATAQAKAELLEALPADGVAILNADCPFVRRVASRLERKTVWFGRSADCDLLATEISARRGWLRFRVETQKFAVPVWGRHFLTSALAAIAVGREFGMTLSEIADALVEFEPPTMRCEVEHLAQRTVINDTYNACPTAMRAALELLRDFDAGGRRVVICGDMLELGAAAEQYHRTLGREVVEHCGANLVIACGQHAAVTVAVAQDAGMPAARAIACRTVEQVRDVIDQHLWSDDVVLVKGSRGMRMERVVEWLREDAYQPEPYTLALPRMFATAA